MGPFSFLTYILGGWPRSRSTSANSLRELSASSVADLAITIGWALVFDAVV